MRIRTRHVVDEIVQDLAALTVDQHAPVSGVLRVAGVPYDVPSDGAGLTHDRHADVATVLDLKVLDDKGAVVVCGKRLLQQDAVAEEPDRAVLDRDVTVVMTLDSLGRRRRATAVVRQHVPVEVEHDVVGVDDGRRDYTSRQPPV